MPIILFDPQIFKLQRFGGISRYFSHLIIGISGTKGYEAIPKKYFSNNHHLASGISDKRTFIYRLNKFRGKARLIRYLHNEQDKRIKNLIGKGKFDIFHPTYYNYDFLNVLPANKPFVLTVHDMIHEIYHDHHYKKIHDETRQKSVLIPAAAHIIAISENTKKDILSLYPQVEPEKISVIYHGYSKTTNGNQKKNTPFKYILFVGNRRDYKNFDWMLQAITEFLKLHHIVLLCAGGGAFADTEREMISKNGLDSRVIFCEIESDIFLNDLYAQALCFIFPSLYEGFGLPILEAFENSCPVILTNASCFPEIAADAALYFEPKEPESLASQLTLLHEREDIRRHLINSGKKRLANFSWDKTVEQHKKVYDLVINANH